jgi:hypothetical protein
MTTHTWKRPNAAQASRGIIAVNVAYHHSSIGTIYEQSLDYTAAMLERRIARGGDLPYWITIKGKE